MPFYWAPIDSDEMKGIPGHVKDKDGNPALPVKCHGQTYFFIPYEAQEIHQRSGKRFKRFAAAWDGKVREIKPGTQEEADWVAHRGDKGTRVSVRRPSTPKPEVKVILPSKRVLERLNKDDLHELAECAGMELNPALTKIELVEALEKVRS